MSHRVSQEGAHKREVPVTPTAMSCRINGPMSLPRTVVLHSSFHFCPHLDEECCREASLHPTMQAFKRIETDLHYPSLQYKPLCRRPWQVSLAAFDSWPCMLHKLRPMYLTCAWVKTRCTEPGSPVDHKPHLHIYTGVCMYYVYMYIYMCVYICVCVHLCIYMYACIHIYI